MRLLDAYSLEIYEFHGNDIPPYVILSHTWGPDEVTFQDFQDAQNLTDETRGKQGFSKIELCCQLARQNGFGYAWVDTCCIDKKNHVELSEAINSMYMWYANAEICFALLEDVLIGGLFSDATFEEQLQSLSNSRWFTRGWTLQELISPPCVVFYDLSGEMIGTKSSLQKEISSITKIPEALLGDRPKRDLSVYSVAERMSTHIGIRSWAANRKTTRVEDEAYCLLGIFDVNMPLIYGEGQHAFLRLQEEILRKTEDYSILAWGDAVSCRLDSESGIMERGSCDVLARSSAMFKTGTGMMRPYMTNRRKLVDGESKNEQQTIQPMAMTSRGLFVCMQRIYYPYARARGGNEKACLALLGYELMGRVVGILLKEVNLQGEFVRLNPPGKYDAGFVTVSKADISDFSEKPYEAFYISRYLRVSDHPAQVAPWCNLSIDMTHLNFCFTPGNPIAIDTLQTSALASAQKLSAQTPEQFVMKRSTRPFFLRVSAFRYFIIPAMTEDYELFAIILRENGSIILRYESSPLQVDSHRFWLESLKETARAMGLDVDEDGGDGREELKLDSGGDLDESKDRSGNGAGNRQNQLELRLDLGKDI
ncbi:hypothetical protein O1611_g7017 [Lasiodiplodia mahajangana]|uniref:Uncharacterized protein n=1 Tax=Lasiodiplodia mahajangana TaxID=1108764 RepID=A0ACC2JGI2_9PEZI|nr:hypothetical protein O1611_g7017 [Lasiodiplodia mahajangana]